MEYSDMLYLKFGNLPNLVSLRSKGLIYCNTLHYFTGIEDGKVRGDKDETCIEMKYLGVGTMTIKLHDQPNIEPIKFQTTNAHYKEYQHEHIANMYCLSSITFPETKGNSTPLYDIKCAAFGTHVLFIMDSFEFMRRIEAKLDSLGLQYEIRPVIYQDLSKYTGQKDLFVKDLNYAYQKEIRLLIKTQSKEKFIFEIGSIEDISRIFEMPPDNPILIDYAPPAVNE